jgi:hypothetical protein
MPELLEFRIAPATFIVTSLADAGPGSLRDANDQAGADVIVFERGLTGTIEAFFTRAALISKSTGARSSVT